MVVAAWNYILLICFIEVKKWKKDGREREKLIDKDKLKPTSAEQTDFFKKNGHNWSGDANYNQQMHESLFSSLWSREFVSNLPLTLLEMFPRLFSIFY